MEQIYYFKKSIPKLFIWLAIITFLLVALGSVFSDNKVTYTNISILGLGILYLLQYIFYKRWNIKTDKENIYIRNSPFTRPKKIPLAKISGSKTLTTGDLLLKLPNKELIIFKDLLEEAHFQEIKETITQVTQ